MSNYVANFHRQLVMYSDRYGHNYGKISWHAICFLLRHWFGDKYGFKRSGNTVNIGFFLPISGLGDIVVTGAYIDRFIKKLDCDAKVYLFVNQSVDDVQVLFGEYSDKVTVTSADKLKHIPLDLVISFRVQFPELDFYRSGYISKKSHFLPEYVEKITDFCTKYRHLFETDNIFSQQILLDIHGLNRVSGMDVVHALGMSDKDTMNIDIPRNTTDVLCKYGLEQDKFITFAYSIDALSNAKHSIRMWPKEKLQEFINKIKAIYPDYKIVQLGSRSFAKFDSVDVNLVGKTSFSDLLCLLAAAKLHIDSECGMVHLRHAINGKTSVVLHGPTSVSTKGYPENINIRANVCNCSCCEALLHNNWQDFCIKTNSAIPACMQAISPDTVISKIKDVLE